MPKHVLDPPNAKQDGLVFLGLSLARNHFYGLGEGKDGKEGKVSLKAAGDKIGHPDSYTHQTAFDMNLVLDRDHEFVKSTDDIGWLVGGGEPGPPTCYKMPSLDSAHVEITAFGSYRREWGGLPREEILDAMASGDIRIPQIEVLPTDVVLNPDKPPEIEVRFDMEEASAESKQAQNLASGDFEAFCKDPLPINWQLRFLHNQLFKTFIFPSRFCPGPFHSTIVRKAEFRSEEHEKAYLAKCTSVLEGWRKEGPKALNTIPRHLDTRPLTTEEIEAAGDENKGFESGLWLFTHRAEITHFFKPNFLPPYDCPEKRRIIFDVLKEEWDEHTLTWNPCGKGSMNFNGYNKANDAKKRKEPCA